MLKVLEISGKGRSLNGPLIRLLYKHSYMTADTHIVCVNVELECGKVKEQERKITIWPKVILYISPCKNIFYA